MSLSQAPRRLCFPDATKSLGTWRMQNQNEDRGVSSEREIFLPGRRLVKVELGWEEARLQE